ncbi:MAG: nitroreductase family protein [Thermoplasmatota archaeon]
MNTYKAIENRRSIRKFKDKEVPHEVLKRCVNAARLSPNGANRQPLRFITITEKLDEIFEHTNWAGYLEWDPDEDQMPRAYVAVLKKSETGSDIDVGIASQSICLTAYNQGVDSCMLGAIDRKALTDILPVPEDCELKLLIALGYGDEVSEVVERSDTVKYYKEDDVLKVPKKPLEEVWIASI